MKSCMQKERSAFLVRKYLGHIVSVKYLGHIIESGHIRADPDKVEAICTWPKLTMVKKL